MVDKDLVLGVCPITSIHDKSREMPKAIDPEGIAVEVRWWCLELDQCRCLVLLAVEDDFANRLEVFIVVNQRTEELVDHAPPQAMSVSFEGTVLEKLNTSLDQVRASLPL